MSEWDEAGMLQAIHRAAHSIKRPPNKRALDAATKLGNCGHAFDGNFVEKDESVFVGRKTTSKMIAAWLAS